jgi:hypothetical protein
MLYINLLLVLLVPLAAGVLFLSLFNLKKELYFWEKLALAFLTGLILIVMIMFLLALAHIPVDRATILVSWSLLSVLAAWYVVRKDSFLFDVQEARGALKLDLRGWSAVEYLLLALLSLKTIYLFFVTLVKPVIDVDAISMYSIGAKGIFYSKSFLTPFVFERLSGKPLFPFLSQAWVLIGLGDFNDCLIKVLTPVMFLCLLVIFYSASRRYFPRLAALVFTFLLSTLPFMVFHAATAYSDFPQMAYYALGAIYLFLFMKEEDQGRAGPAVSFLTVSAVLLGASVWVKRGGLALVVLNLAVLIVYLLMKNLFNKDKWRAFLPAAIAFLVISLPSIVYGQAGFLFRGVAGIVGGATTETASSVGEASRFQVVMETVLKKLFLYADWQLLFLLFLLVLIFCFRRAYKGPLLYLLAVILLDLGAIAAQFSFGSSFAYLLDGTLLDRLVMSVVPVVLFYCACVLIPYFEAEADYSPHPR